MRRCLFVLLAVSLSPSLANAQINCSQSQASCAVEYVSGGAWDGGAFTSAATGPTGCTNPAFSFTGDTNAGLCLSAANDISLQTTATASTGSVLRLATGSGLYLYGYDSGNANGFNIGTAAHDFRFVLNGGTVFVLDNTLGSGLIAGKGTNAAVARSIAAGTGVSVSNGDGQSGNPTVAVDTATTPQFSSGTASPPGTCTVGQTYLETDVPRSCECSATNTWVCGSGDVSLAGTPDYITISGQTITRGSVDLAADVTGDLPLANVAQASGASVLLGRGSAGGAGDFQEITLGSGLSMSGTALSASASSFDPGTTFELYEEFASGELSQDRVGTNGLRYPVLSSGDGAYVASTATHPGQFRLTSSTTDNSGAFISAGGGGSSFHNIYDGSLLNTNDWQIDTVLLVGSNSTAITTSAIWVGWTPSVTGTPDSQGNGIWIRRDTDLSDTSFIFQVCDGAGGTGCGASGDNTNSTVVASTITPSAGTAYRFRIRFDPTGVSSNPTLYFRVNNETEKTFCSSGCDDVISNMPGSGVGLGYFVVAYFTRDVSTRSGDVDYLYIKVENLARY